MLQLHMNRTLVITPTGICPTQQTHASAYTLPLSFESKIARHCLTVYVSTSLKEIMFLPEILLRCEKAYWKEPTRWASVVPCPMAPSALHGPAFQDMLRQFPSSEPQHPGGFSLFSRQARAVPCLIGFLLSRTCLEADLSSYLPAFWSCTVRICSRLPLSFYLPGRASTDKSWPGGPKSYLPGCESLQAPGESICTPCFSSLKVIFLVQMSRAKQRKIFL